MTGREFWFSQALEAGGPVGDYGDPPDGDATTAESGLIEVVDGQPYVERHAAPWWLLPSLPADAVRLTPDDPADTVEAVEVGDYAAPPGTREDLEHMLRAALLLAVADIPDGHPLPRGRYVTRGLRNILAMLDYHGLAHRLLDGDPDFDPENIEWPPPTQQTVHRMSDDEHASIGIDRTDHLVDVATCKCGAQLVITDRTQTDRQAREWWDQHREEATA